MAGPKKNCGDKPDSGWERRQFDWQDILKKGLIGGLFPPALLFMDFYNRIRIFQFRPEDLLSFGVVLLVFIKITIPIFLSISPPIYNFLESDIVPLLNSLF